MSAHIHLAGIIPVANLKTDFELATPSVLLPINVGFTAIQKSVFECAMAGCQTIWVVANDDLAPIIKKVIGEGVYDPVHYNRTFGGFPAEVSLFTMFLFIRRIATAATLTAGRLCTACTLLGLWLTNFQNGYVQKSSLSLSLWQCMTFIVCDNIDYRFPAPKTTSFYHMRVK